MSPDAQQPPFRLGPFAAAGLFAVGCVAAACAVLGLAGGQLTHSAPLATVGAIGLVLALSVTALLWQRRALSLGASVVVTAVRFVALFLLARVEGLVRRDLRDHGDL